MKTYNYSDKKAVLILSSQLETSVALNVVGHLSISLGNNTPSDELMGRETLFDKDKNQHKGISRYPLIATKVKPARLKKLIHEVKSNFPDLFIADYPEDMLHTKHDDELAKSLSNKSEIDIKYLGVLIYGDTEKVNQLTGKFTLWR